MTTKSPTEYVEQVRVCERLSLAGVFYFSVPNEHKDVTQITKLKKTGMIPGIPDLCILHDDTVYFLEMKSTSGRMSDQQTIIHGILMQRGYHVATAYGYDDAMRILTEWGIV